MNHFEFSPAFSIISSLLAIIEEAEVRIGPSIRTRVENCSVSSSVFLKNVAVSFVLFSLGAYSSDQVPRIQ
jgi:hypothetical protein